jgi:hypothetical protein
VPEIALLRVSIGFSPFPEQDLRTHWSFEILLLLKISGVSCNQSAASAKILCGSTSERANLPPLVGKMNKSGISRAFSDGQPLTSTQRVFGWKIRA